MVNCSYCKKELDRNIFCSPSHKVMFYRRVTPPVIQKVTPVVPKTVKEVKKVIVTKFDGLCEHHSMKGLCKYGCK